MYEVWLIDGEDYTFDLDNTSGNADLGLAIYYAHQGFFSKSQYNMMANANGDGADETFSWTADTTGWFPLVVFKTDYADYSDANIYTLSVYEFTCGDADGDGSVVIQDAVYLVNYIFKKGPEPMPVEAGDANCDGNVSIADVVYLINYLFKRGPDPCDPDDNGVPDC